MVKEQNPNFKGFWVRYSDYQIEEIEGEYYIKPVQDSSAERYNVFDVEKTLLVDFLKLGKISEDYIEKDIECEIQSRDEQVQELVLGFVKKYGLIGEAILQTAKKIEGEHDEHYLNIDENSAEKISTILVQAKLMYYVFNHIETYLDDESKEELNFRKELATVTVNEFKLNDLECSLDLKDKKFFMFNFTSLVQAMKIILMLQTTNDRKEVKMCKHCGTPFVAKNINAHYCSTTCRNVSNVYKSRARKKKV